MKFLILTIFLIMLAPIAQAQAQSKLIKNVELIARDAAFQPGLSRVVDHATGNILYVYKPLLSSGDSSIVIKIIQPHYNGRSNNDQ